MRGQHRREKSLFLTLQFAFSEPGSKLVTRTVLGKLIYGEEVRDDKLYEGRTLRFPLTEQSWLSLVYHVSSSRVVIDKELALTALYDYGVSQGYTYNPLRPEDELIKVLHFVFCKENDEFLTYSQLSQEVGLRHSLITDNINNGGVFYDKTLAKIGIAISQKITNQFDKDLAFYALGNYVALDREYQKRSSTSRAVWLSRLGYAPFNRRSLYHRNWNNLRNSHVRNLMIEQMGLDVLTGRPLNLRRSRTFCRHHYKYDKSSINIDDIILLLRGSHSKVKHARRQTGYGGNVIHVGDSRQHMIWLQEAKNDLLAGRVPRHWTDPSHPWHQFVDSDAVSNFNSRRSLFGIWGYQIFLWGRLP